MHIGGEDGVREGYFEVELAADAEDGAMEFNVSIVNTGLIMTLGITLPITHGISIQNMAASGETVKTAMTHRARSN